MVRLGVLGTGRMGAAMAACAAHRGATLHVWNRSGPRPSLPAAARVCSSPAQVAAEVQVVLVMVAGYDAVRDVLDQDVLHTLASRRVLLLLGCFGPPPLARSINQEIAEAGVRVVDVAFMSSPMHARAGIGKAFFVCQAEDKADAEAALALLGESHYLGDDMGGAKELEICTGHYWHAAFMGLLYSAVHAHRTGVDPDAVRAAVAFLEQNMFPAMANVVMTNTQAHQYPGTLFSAADMAASARAHVAQCARIGAADALPALKLKLAEQAVKMLGSEAGAIAMAEVVFRDAVEDEGEQKPRSKL